MMVSRHLQKRSYVYSIICIFLVSSLWHSVWFKLDGEGVYTEGIEREPTIVVEYTIDNSHELVSVSIENATPLLQYWSNRETIEDRNQVPSNDSDENDRSRDTEEESSENNDLESTREIIRMLLSLFTLLIIYSAFKMSKKSTRLAIIFWLVISLIFLIQVPLSAVSDFGLDEDGESSTGGFDAANNDQVSVNQFAHFESYSDLGLGALSIKFEYSSEGFDLGLLPPEEHESVIQEKPMEGEPGFDSLITFEAEMNAGPSEAIIWLIAIGLLVVYWNKSINNESSEGNNSV